MLKRLLLTALVTALAVSIGYAQKPPKNVTIPVHNVPANNGKMMYMSYCAPCHGVDAKGNGPVASELKTPPADLTMLSMQNGGKYPVMHMISVLRFGSEAPAHGTAEMPVWGPVLGKMSPASPAGEDLRIWNLARYLKTLQAK
jgi:mono/diheme cytochrome c family protein